ncbi:pilus assembly protein [Rhodoferax sp.]|uniref:pilus assembly PilX family protein n=1 Tax=Rhodoferax sp. TaxID=50421 RepID=UPI002635CAF4|nr:pilus assembly protein [Rhodoferax sp.]MDD3937835.1 pilus assembly protein [Rhodoferax sp.]
MKPRRSAHRAYQRGMTLVIALVFLVVLAFIGAWSVSNNSLQSRMAGNTRNRDVALAAAEAALKYAESTLKTWRLESFDGVGGLLTYNALDPNDAAYWMNSAQWSSYQTLPSGGLNQVISAPKYIVQKMPNTLNDVSGLYDVENYRITARAEGMDATSVVILQSILMYIP